MQVVRDIADTGAPGGRRPQFDLSPRTVWGPALVMVCALLGGCDNKHAQLGSGPGEPPPSGAPVSYREDILPIFRDNCSLSGCHDSGGSSANLDLVHAFDRRIGLVNVLSEQAPAVLRVKPRHPEASYILYKLRGNPEAVGGGGERMPFGAGALPDASIALIERWILDGAQND